MGWDIENLLSNCASEKKGPGSIETSSFIWFLDQKQSSMSWRCPISKLGSLFRPMVGQIPSSIHYHLITCHCRKEHHVVPQCSSHLFIVIIEKVIYNLRVERDTRVKNHRTLKHVHVYFTHTISCIQLVIVSLKLSLLWLPVRKKAFVMEFRTIPFLKLNSYLRYKMALWCGRSNEVYV